MRRRRRHPPLTSPPSILRLIPLMVISVLRLSLPFGVLADVVLLVAGRFGVLDAVYLVVLVALFRPLGVLQRELAVDWVNRRP